MKRESRSYEASEVTYTFTRDDVIKALCKVHTINLPYNEGPASSWQAFDIPESVAIRLRWEKATDVPVAAAPVVAKATAGQLNTSRVSQPGDLDYEDTSVAEAK